MRSDISLSPEAIDDLHGLKANVRAVVWDAIETYLRRAPTKTSKSRIKRLRGLSRPQFRLRVGEVRVYYEDIIITRHGKPAGILIGFESEDDWFDHRLEHEPAFLQRVERARKNLRAGLGMKLENMEE
jgi:mRNA-degrading endonuclease RelE of RelBE toxin-antitoxin system